MAGMASAGRAEPGDAHHHGGTGQFTVTRATTADIEAQAASLRAWDQVYEQMTPGEFVGSLHELSFAGVQVFREATSQAVHECGSPRNGSRAFGAPVRMEGAARFRGEPADAGALITLGGNDELDFYAPRGFEILALVVDEGALGEHARQVEHRDPATTFEGRSVFRPASERLNRFRHLLGSVLQSVDVNPAALEFGPSQRVLEQTLLTAALDVVSEDDAPAAPSACPSRRHLVDAAQAYMRAHIAEPITVADLCRELGVSRRTLQYGFHEVLGTNPVQFLRAMRLNGVRRDLRSGGRPPGSVQDAAARWGFWHLGQFVTDYKRMFGELPSETLRRGGPAGFARGRN